ncbi:MAG: hypothetical protein RLZZ522_851 [Verrucomicrobiota bacterium]
MSWIKDNKFAAMLGGITLLVAIVLLYVGMTFRSKYSKALLDYQAAAGEVDEFESLPLYPSDANRDGKTKALNDYRAAITGLRNSFDKFRPKELNNIAPQDFTGNAKSAQAEVKSAFESAKTKLPDDFFLGFEDYASGSLAPGDATGILNFQLGAIKHLMLALAKAAPSQVQNLHRPKPPEEDGGKWVAGADDAYRAYPMEVTFKGTEHSARKFLDALANSPDYFYCVRCVRIANDTNKAPNKADAKFEAAPGSAKAPASPFGAAGAFVLPGDEPAALPAATPAAPAKAADTSRVLNQVLGDEEIEMFLRLDVLQFLPAKELPAVPK